MPTSIPAVMAAEQTNHPDRCYSTFEVDLNGTMFRWSDRYVASTSAGMYKKRIAWSPFSRKSAGRTFSFVGPSASIDIVDDDQELGKILGGQLRGYLLNASCSGYTRSDEIPAASHYNFFTGKVRDWALTGPRRYRFDLSANTLPLESLENAIPKITSTDWPNAPEKIIKSGDFPGQVVYGRHKSGGIAGSFGLVEAIPVDNGLNQEWYVSLGILDNAASGLNPIRIYRQAGGSGDFVEEVDWTVVHRVVNGRSYTLIAHNTAAANLEEDVVRVDCDGIETNGNGDTGTLITSPSIAIQHFLNNFIYNSWPTGAGTTTMSSGLVVPSWFTSSNDVDATQITAALTNGFFANHTDHTAARVVKSTDRGIDVLNDLGQSFGINFFITSNWKIGGWIMDPYVQDISTARLIRIEDLDLSISGTPRTDALTTHITVSWGEDSARGTIANGPIVIEDANRTPLIKRSLQLRWHTPSVIGEG